MIQKGQFLEMMIANLQSYLGPEGVEVKLREKFYNPESGKQIGEIDITVRGEFGTSRFFFGVECRDRPADGPQGLPWIREIVGKKQQLRPDKMIAVSSTGFTDDAKDFADQNNIDLITIGEPTEVILKEWFQLFYLSYTDYHYDITAPVTLNLVDPTRKPPADSLNFGSKDLVFIVPPFGMQTRSLESLLKDQIQKELPAINDAMDLIRMTVTIPSPLVVKLNDEIYPLHNVVTEVDIIPKTHRVMALFNVCDRLSDRKTIALTSAAKMKIQDKEITFLIVAKKDHNPEGTMSIRIHYYDDAGQETTLPEGTAVGMRCEY
jgi:hypothetical protein